MIALLLLFIAAILPADAHWHPVVNHHPYRFVAPRAVPAATAAVPWVPSSTVPSGWPTRTQGFIPANLQAGDRIVFVGDSLTQYGTSPDGPGGWIDLFSIYMTQAHPNTPITVIGSGVGGNTVQQVRARLTTTVLHYRPTVVVIFVGIHDIYYLPVVNNHYDQGAYGYCLNDCVAVLKAAGVREVVLMTPFASGEHWDGENTWDNVIDTMSQTIKDVAWSAQVACIDTRTAWGQAERKYNRNDVGYGILTVDGIHPYGTFGSQVLANIITVGFGQ